MRTIIKISYVLDDEDKKSIKKQMVDKDLTLNGMAKNLGVSASYLCDVIKGNKHFTPKLKAQFKSQGIILPENETVTPEIISQALYSFEKYKEFFTKVNNEIYMDAYDERCFVDYKTLHNMLVENIKKYMKEIKDDTKKV